MAEKYTKDEIVSLLKNDVLRVVFTKVSTGETREMDCTLLEEFLPEVVAPDPDVPPKAPRKPNPDVVAVWDLSKKSWRSFRLDSIQSVDVVHTDSID